MKQHKWHKEIKAWADGAEIETCKAGVWFENDYPQWHSSDYQFRIKPQPKEKQYLYFYNAGGIVSYEKDKIEGWGSVYLGKIEVQDD